MKKHAATLLFFTLLSGPSVFLSHAEPKPVVTFIPRIEKLKSSDFLFEQYQQDVQISNRNLFKNSKIEIIFYKYKASKDDTLISIASRCSIRQDTLATINSISESKANIEGKTLLLPACDGLFIPEIPENSFEILLSNEHKEEIPENSMPAFNGNRKFNFLPGKKFSMSLRAYFLNPGLKMPLEKSMLTSSYGMRVSPVSGKWKMHKGIDLAAEKGSRILACKEGFVRKLEKGNPVYGNYIILRHPDGMESFYAHMDLLKVIEGQNVVSGQQLGTVGMTGLTTGPHLHFEISRNGSSLNPENYLKK